MRACVYVGMQANRQRLQEVRERRRLEIRARRLAMGVGKHHKAADGAVFDGIPCGDVPIATGISCGDIPLLPMREDVCVKV